MALPSQIAAAASAPPKPGLRSFHDNDEALTNIGRQDALSAALERDLARWFVLRLANGHDCPGRCEDPRHADDVGVALEVLEALGLRRTP